MAATIDVSVIIEAFELDGDVSFISKETDGTTPNTYVKHMPTLAVADTEESLDVGDVSTAQLLVIKAIDFDLDVDLDFVTLFDADLTVKAGGPAAVIPNPAGTIKVKNSTASQAPQYKYLLIGAT
jgi:hypothetical protein